MLRHVLGLDDASGAWYLWWSGVGSFLIGLSFLGGLITVVRRHQCEVHRCWRLGRHGTAAGQHVCRKHHPDGHLTFADICRQHHLYLGKQPGRG